MRPLCLSIFLAYSGICAALDCPAKAPEEKPSIPTARDSGQMQARAALTGSDVLWLLQAFDAMRWQGALVAMAERKGLGKGDLLSRVEELSRALQAQAAVLDDLVAMRGFRPESTPTNAMKLSLETLESLSGARFEKELLRQLIAADSAALLAVRQGETSKDPALAAYIAEALPKVRSRLALLRKLGGNE